MNKRFCFLLLLFLLAAFTVIDAAQTQSTDVYLVALNGDADFRSLWEHPIAVSKAQFSQGPAGLPGGIGSVGSGAIVGTPGGTIPFDQRLAYLTLLGNQFKRDLSPLEDPTISVSKLDLKAPSKARKEFEKALTLISRRDYQGAVARLTQAISIYPEFVAAHNALGTSYLALGQNASARDEFTKAASLDDHLPISHLNLGVANFVLKDYPAAESAVQKAATIAPLDQQVQTALAYAQLQNHDYTGTIATVKNIHSRKHSDVAIAHYYAAAAWDGLGNPKGAETELQTFLQEDPKSPAAMEAMGILQHIREDLQKSTVATLTLTAGIEAAPTPVPAGPAELPSTGREFIQQQNEAKQIAEVEAMCDGCEAGSAPNEASATRAGVNMVSTSSTSSGFNMHKDVDEVAVFFAATDHGRAVESLTMADVTIRDKHMAPASILGFRSEAQLPLRLGLVIDTSNSVLSRFSFEQSAAANFIQQVLTGKDDLAFVVGFSNSVLLVQDFTNDNKDLGQAINKLAPAGGTALWDAVAFGAEKLGNQHESQPVAKVLVVISDGEDNSSSYTMKQALETAERGEVTVYAVSTHEHGPTTVVLPKYEEMFVGDRALKTLADRTGGSTFFPGSVRELKHSLADLQEVIRSRYLVSYRPASFRRDGEYRPIEIVAEKSGHKLHIYARKGYHAEPTSAP